VGADRPILQGDDAMTWRCIYCGSPRTLYDNEQEQPCCGELHFEDDEDPESCFNDPTSVMYIEPKHLGPDYRTVAEYYAHQAWLEKRKRLAASDDPRDFWLSLDAADDRKWSDEYQRDQIAAAQSPDMEHR
jgi:hypothetical protein